MQLMRRVTKVPCKGNCTNVLGSYPFFKGTLVTLGRACGLTPEATHDQAQARSPHPEPKPTLLTLKSGSGSQHQKLRNGVGNL